jgi:selenocysteine-specific elongation factor
VVATAGHVDHGKSALVRALTGMEPDRYAEERRRGMTIDLGFVWTTLPGATGDVPEGRGSASDMELAFVDVPGHERFVSTMLAGAGPVPAVLLVVAADEGWMPQSSEHLDALDALGVRHGVVAISRSDLADPAASTRDVHRRLRGTSLEGSEVVPVSAVTGVGLDDLRGALARMVSRIPSPETDADVRLWVDRSFTVSGAGTVVTGTLPAGAVQVDDELDLHSAGGVRRVQVRGLHSLGRARTSVGGVARLAVNLRGVAHDEVARGDALTAPGTVTRGDLLDVRLHLAVGAAGRLPQQCRAHVGSAQVTGNVRPLDGDLARLRLARPLPLRRGDRLLLRDPGRHQVLGAAVVLDPDPPSLHRRGDARRRAAELAAVPDEPRVADELARRGTVTVIELRALGFSPSEVDAAGALQVGNGYLVHADLVPQLRERLTTAVREHRRSRPLDLGLPVERARQLLGLPDVRIVAAVVGAAARTDEPALGVREGRVVLTAEDAARLPEGVADAVRMLRADLDQRPFLAPDAGRLDELGLDRQALGAAVRAGELARVAQDVYLAPDWLERATAALETIPEPFGVADVRRALDTTRRVAVPLLERLDADRVTRRLPDDRRVLRRDTPS